jgi:hypothetical protein
MTTETNGTSAEQPENNPARGEEKMRKRWHGCLIAVLVMMAFLFLVLLFLSQLGRARPETVARACRSDLEQAYRGMGWFIKDHVEEEIPSDWTIPDLIREWHYDWKMFFCPGPSSTYRDPYLAFPVPASVLLNPEQEPVQILMCRPGVHGKYGTPVLYSDGTVKNLTTKEAVKLVAEQHPVPLEIKRPDPRTGQEEQKP